MLVGLVVVGLLYAFFASLNYLTNHNQETKVPALEGKSMNEAVNILKRQGFKINLDSTYRSYETPLKVLFQEPSAGSTVKVGRTIFLTINRKTPPSIEMPNLVNISFRNALLQMQSYRLTMGDTTYRPDVAAGAVLEQWFNGKPILPGQLVPLGSRIDLVIGEGLSDMQDVPNFIGMTWQDARAFIQSHNLIANPVFEGDIVDSNNAIIFSQQPEALNELDFKNSIMSGDIMDLRIMQNPSAEILQQNQPGSQKLLGEDTRQLDSNGNLIEEKPLMDLPVTPSKLDTAPKRNKVPGINVPNAAKDKPIGKMPDPSSVKKNTTSKNGANTKSVTNNVNAKSDAAGKDLINPKPKPKKTKEAGANSNANSADKVETKPKTAPIKKSDDNIKNEFD